MTAKDDAITALEPVRAQLLRTAAQQAARIRADASGEAARIVGRARREAGAALAQARDDGRAQAAPLAAVELSRARGQARSALLRARREASEELRGQVRAAVSALPGQPGYDELAQRLARLAGRAAGPEASLSPAPSGGVVARSPGVIVDCSLTRLADLAVDSLGGDVRGLWTP
ncbi:MAG TPA: V-type ATP synthase subunit E family protein [Streptosporangiaceae bacterium]|nr:V-type ATP synthase subunit E family protein [Streptosporangiaceae bacterium]